MYIPIAYASLIMGLWYICEFVFDSENSTFSDNSYETQTSVCCKLDLIFDVDGNREKD